MSKFAKALSLASAAMVKSEAAFDAANKAAVADPSNEKLADAVDKAAADHKAKVEAFDAAKTALDADAEKFKADQADADAKVTAQAAKSTPATRGAPTAGKAPALRIASKSPKGFWRCGTYHGPQPVEHEVGTFTDEQAEILWHDPDLIVSVVD